MESEAEELNALRRPFGDILARINVDIEDSRSSGGCPRASYRSCLGLASRPFLFGHRE